MTGRVNVADRINLASLWENKIKIKRISKETGTPHSGRWWWWLQNQICPHVQSYHARHLVGRRQHCPVMLFFSPPNSDSEI